MIESSEKTIGDVEYIFQPIAASKARKALVELVNKLGPVLGDGLSNLNQAKMKKVDLDGEAIMELLPALSGSFGTMINTLATTISPDFYDKLVELFVSRIYAVEGDAKIRLKKDIREERFATSLLTESKLLIWALEEQYSDFFGSWRKVIASASTEMTTMMSKLHSSSPPKSTGTATE